MTVLGLSRCMRAFFSFGEQWRLFVAVPGPLIVVAALVVEHGALGSQILAACRLTGLRAQH